MTLEFEFIKAAVVPREGSHAEGTLEDANALLATHPDLATASIHTAAILGDASAVARFIASDASTATSKGGPYDWDALTHLCFSRYLRIDEDRIDGFVRCSEMILAAGASANTGFFENEHQPKPEWESALYGAAGVAHSPQITRVLLAHGADPNDNEVPYHSPETYDNRAMQLLVESGRMTAENLSMMLIRKIDWHDYDGATWLLEHGADPAHVRWRGFMPLVHALSRDNSNEMIEKLLDHGADPLIEHNGRSGLLAAAWCGRGDVLAIYERRGFDIALTGVNRLVAACASGDDATIASMRESDPDAVRDLHERGGFVLARFALSGNGEGVRRLLGLGIPVDARYQQEDGYWGLGRDATALHVAAWLARHPIVQILIDAGADVNARDSHGFTPLMYAVKACIDSYWMRRREPASVAALLRAGAAKDGIELPTGYDAIDELLKKT